MAEGPQKRKEAKEKKGKKKSAVKEEEIERDEFDMMVDDKAANRSLSEKLGFDLSEIKGKKKKKSPLDDSDDDDEDDVKPPKAAAKPKAKKAPGPKKSKKASEWDSDMTSSDEDAVMSDLSGMGKWHYNFIVLQLMHYKL